MSCTDKKNPKQFKQEDLREKMDASIRPGGVFMVQLLMKERCDMPSKERMAEVLSRYIGKVKTADFSDNSDLLNNMEGISLFMAMEHIGYFKENRAPVQVSIMPCETFQAEKIDEMKRRQMWDVMTERDRILSECKYCVFANDILGGALEPLERANFLMDYLEALLELFPACEAVYSLNSGKLILADVVRRREAAGLERYVSYIVNTRFFNINGTNDHVIDTLGLSLLYIEDLQYHFHSMDPNWVVGHAYSMASYILHNHCPIKEGDTIDGVTDGRLDQNLQWKCHFEDALIKPERAVLDIYMNEYAAGRRHD
jgi:hypothetical protein